MTKSMISPWLVCFILPHLQRYHPRGGPGKGKACIHPQPQPPGTGHSTCVCPKLFVESINDAKI